MGLFQGEFSLNDPEFHKRETTLLGSRNSLPEDFTRIIRMIEAKQIDTARWITHRVAAAELVRDISHVDAAGDRRIKGDDRILSGCFLEETMNFLKMTLATVALAIGRGNRRMRRG